MAGGVEPLQSLTLKLFIDLGAMAILIVYVVHLIGCIFFCLGSLF